LIDEKLIYLRFVRLIINVLFLLPEKERQQILHEKKGQQLFALIYCFKLYHINTF
jgi:hypothetical protein